MAAGEEKFVGRGTEVRTFLYFKVSTPALQKFVPVDIPPYRKPGVNYDPKEGHFMMHDLIASAPPCRGQAAAFRLRSRSRRKLAGGGDGRDEVRNLHGRQVDQGARHPQQVIVITEGRLQEPMHWLIKCRSKPGTDTPDFAALPAAIAA